MRRSSRGGTGISSKSSCRTFGRRTTGARRRGFCWRWRSSSEERYVSSCPSPYPSPFLLFAQSEGFETDVQHAQILNVQVPFFFKDIIDTLNVQIDPSTGQGVFAIAGTVVVGCKSLLLHSVQSSTVDSDNLRTVQLPSTSSHTALSAGFTIHLLRRTRPHFRLPLLRAPERRLRLSCAGRHPKSRPQCLHPPAQPRHRLPSHSTDGRLDEGYRSRNQVRPFPCSPGGGSSTTQLLTSFLLAGVSPSSSPPSSSTLFLRRSRSRWSAVSSYVFLLPRSLFSPSFPLLFSSHF